VRGSSVGVRDDSEPLVGDLTPPEDRLTAELVVLDPCEARLQRCHQRLPVDAAVPRQRLVDRAVVTVVRVVAGGTASWRGVAQRPSIMTSLPAGRRSVAQRSRAACGSGSVQARCRMRTTSTDRSGRSGSAASEVASSTGTFAALALWRARSTIAGEMSLAATS
jgi:hypothetical protein